MKKNEFGKTDLNLSILGFGAGLIGDATIHDKHVENILNSVLDLGINFIDTARGYGMSEERIGKYIGHRRKEYVLSTKVGYDISGHENWTYDIIIAGVENALKLLQTEYLDIVHLHSCEKDILSSGNVIDALLKMKEQGKVKYMAYSGENEELKFAIDSSMFDSIQTSVNICDQRDIDTLIPSAKEKGLGVIAKRPLANAPWTYEQLPVGLYVEEYWKRWKKMNLNFDLPWDEVALRFTAFSANVDTCIVGTTKESNLKKNVEIIEKGPLPNKITEEIKNAFNENDKNWIGQV